MRTTRFGLILVILAVAGCGSVGAQGLAWARGLGGSSGDIAYGVAVDTSDNVISVGSFGGTADFDPGPAVFNLTTLGGVQDAFVSKLDSNGDFVWARQLGGTGASPTARGVAVDAAGNIYVVGDFGATVDFDPGPGVANLTTVGLTDAFVLKLDGNGDFLWVAGLGGSSSELGNSIAVDASGNVHAAGRFQLTVDFDPGAGTANLTSAGSSDAYICKLDTNGNFIWARHFGGTSAEDTRSVALDAAGNVHSFGFFQLVADFDPGAGVFNLTSAGNLDAFVSKLDSNGNFIWARRLGGSNIEEPLALALDATGNVHTVGYFAGTADFDPGIGVANLTSVGSADVFISKLDSNGDFIFARRIGGSAFDSAYAVTVDGSGHVHTGGRFEATVDFDPGAGVVNMTAAGALPDAFISELDAAGNFVDARTFSGTAFEEVLSLTHDAGDLYAAVRFSGDPDFDPGPGVVQLTSAGSNDASVVKLGGSGPAAPDIFEVEIDTTAARTVDGSTTFYAFEVGVVADAGLTSVMVTPPGGGTPFPLVYDPFDDVWFAVFEPYTSLTVLRTDFPLGGYLFEFNGGAASIVLSYTELQPACFVDITFPTETCIVSPTPTLTWTLPGGCSAGAVDNGLENIDDDSLLFDLSFIPASSGSIALPSGPVSPPPLNPLPPLAPLTIGESYVFGVDVVDGQFSNESIGADTFTYFASFRNDRDVEFVVSNAAAIIELQVDRDSLDWVCSGADTIGYDIVRGDLGTLRSSAGNFTASTLGCVINNHLDSFIVNNDAPGPGTGFWYLIREATGSGNGSYTGGGSGELAGRDTEIAASGMDCP